MIRLKLPARPSLLRLLMAVGVFQVLGVPALLAQYGVSPTQTGLFFDDLRARQRDANASTQTGTRDGDVVYDYDSGVYRSKTNDEMGQRSTDYESARALSRPSVRSGSTAASARTVGDYTNYAGQYASPTGFFTPTYISDPFLNGRRNVRLGPINVGFGLYQGFEYNDNITRSSNNPVSDVISTTLLNIDANYQVSQNNRLSLSTAIGYDYYFENPDLAPFGSNGAVLNILPGSTIAFDIKAGPVYITIYDRFSVRPAVRNDFALAPTQLFGVFQNDAGIAANWRVNSDWALALNYMHSNAFALGGDKNQNVTVSADSGNFDRATDSLHGSLTYSPTGTWSAGLDGGITYLDYNQRFNNDAFLGNLGLFVVIPVGNTTYIRMAAGYQKFDFRAVERDDFGQYYRQGPGPAAISITNEDESDLSDFYYSVTVSNQLNSRISHSLSFGREAALNITSNFVAADYINYGMSIVAWKGSRLSLSAYFEDASASGGALAQDTQQFGFDAHLQHRLSSRVALGFGYHYGQTEVDAIGRDVKNAARKTDVSGQFDQHSFTTDLTYALSAKASLSLGYRFYTTQVTSGTFGGFDQNRVIMAINYNF